MATGPVPFVGKLGVAVLLGWFTIAGMVQGADDEEALRRKALALNDVTGDNPILGEITALTTKNVAQTRKLLRVAISLAKQKDQPFNYNGAYILARTALQLRELDASKVFYRICAEQANKLQSVQKLRESYGGLWLIIESLYKDKKYDECAKLSQEFLETLDRQGVAPKLKTTILHDMIRAKAKQGKMDEANRLADNLLKARGNDWRSLALKAWLQNEAGNTEDAFRTYEKALSRIADDDELEKDEKTEAQDKLRERLIPLLVKLGKTDEVRQVMEEILKGKKDNLSKLDLKARLQQSAGQNAAAVKTYEQLLERIPKDDTLKDAQKAVVQDEVREEIMRLLVKLDKLDESGRVLNEWLKGKKDDLETLERKVRLQMMIGQYSAAARTYEDMLARIPKEDSLDDKTKAEEVIRYSLSNVYVEMNLLDKATEQLKMLLAKNPDSPSYNNDLGFIWADHDQNLQEAEKLIRKAIEQDRKQRKVRSEASSEPGDNGAYLDSLGWVLFKQKKYEEAKKYLLEATKAEEGDNIEIYDHLGDVYLGLGEKAKAADIWRKALGLEIKSLREKQRKTEVEKKLKANE
jgi:tetratricopeptide (TPR) repeat protein